MIRPSRLCIDCQQVELASFRQHRCETCRKAKRAQTMRERRAAEAAARAGEMPATTPVPASEVVIDLTLPGAASKPPVFDTGPSQRRSAQTTEIVDYTHGGHAAPVHEYRPDLRGVPGAARRDRVLAEQLARQSTGGNSGAVDGQGNPLFEQMNETSSWDYLQHRDAQLAGTVSFHVPVPGSPAPGRPQQPRVNHLGQSVPRTRRWG